jgi:hypothetical protein
MSTRDTRSGMSMSVQEFQWVVVLFSFAALCPDSTFSPSSLLRCCTGPCRLLYRIDYRFSHENMLTLTTVATPCSIAQWMAHGPVYTRVR